MIKGAFEAPFFVLALLVMINALTFLAFGIDKHQARQNGRRIPERTLLGLSALGGWPAALCAQRFFRHKTRKQPFGIQLLLISALWIVGLVMLFYWRIT